MQGNLQDNARISTQINTQQEQAAEVSEQQEKQLTEEIIRYVIFLKQFEVTKGLHPIVIMAPDGSNPNHLRVYGFGGDMGRIPIAAGEEFLLSGDERYAVYIKEGYSFGRGTKVEIPAWLSDFITEEVLQQYGVSNAQELLAHFLRETDPEMKKRLLVGDLAKYYLPLMLAAQGNRWKLTGGEKSERQVQHDIVKLYLDQNGVKGSDALVLMDVEFDMPLTQERQREKAAEKKGSSVKKAAFVKEEEAALEAAGEAESGKASKPDFVVFDGRAFGFIELKCTKHGFGAGNDLNVHFHDFYDMMYDASDACRWEQYEKCLKRLELLLKYHVIGDSIREGWQKAHKRQQTMLEEMKKGPFEESLFWCGFLFIKRADLTMETIRSRIKLKIMDRCSEKLKIVNETKGAQVYCDYYEGDNHRIDMTKTVQLVHEDLLKREKRAKE